MSVNDVNDQICRRLPGPEIFFNVFMFYCTSYGDKTPKSIFARIFAIFWILFGAIVMAIFTANVTSALTAHSLDMAQTKIAGLKVC